jgi:hypothetical protein
MLVFYTIIIGNRADKGNVQQGFPYHISRCWPQFIEPLPGTINENTNINIKLEAVIGTKEVIKASWWMTATFCTVEIALLILLANVHVSDHTHQWATFADILALLIIGLGFIEFNLYMVTLYFFSDVNFLSQWINISNSISKSCVDTLIIHSANFESNNNEKLAHMIKETYKNISVDSCARTETKTALALEWRPLCDISGLNINKPDSTHKFILHLATIILLALSQNSDEYRNIFLNAAFDIKLYPQRRYKYKYEYIHELSNNIVSCNDLATTIVRRLEDYIRVIRNLDSNILYLSFFWGIALVVLTLLLFAKTPENTSNTYDTLIGIIVTIMVTIMVSTSITIYQMVHASIRGKYLLLAIETLNNNVYGWKRTNSKEFNLWKWKRIIDFFILGNLGPLEHDIEMITGIDCVYTCNMNHQQNTLNDYKLVINLSHLFIDPP